MDFCYLICKYFSCIVGTRYAVSLHISLCLNPYSIWAWHTAALHISCLLYLLAGTPYNATKRRRPAHTIIRISLYTLTGGRIALRLYIAYNM
jgi:hypothetical protein